MKGKFWLGKAEKNQSGLVARITNMWVGVGRTVHGLRIYHVGDRISKLEKEMVGTGSVFVSQSPIVRTIGVLLPTLGHFVGPKTSFYQLPFFKALQTLASFYYFFKILFIYLRPLSTDVFFYTCAHSNMHTHTHSIFNMAGLTLLL